MRVVDAEAIDRALTFPALVAALSDAFAGGFAAPPRHHHSVPRSDGPDATLLLMPAWTEGTPGFLGVKSVTVFPANGARGLPSVQGTYLLLDGATGVPRAALDGARLTLWRTAAASALAARHLARPDAGRLLMVGAGALAPFLIRAHAAVRPIASVAIWARRPEAAAALAAEVSAEGLPGTATPDLDRAVASADIVSCATLSSEPLVRGALLRAGTHLDLVGAFTPAMREADDDALRRSRLFVDTEAALHEGGDVAAALAAGTLPRSHVQGTLADLVAGRRPGRTGPDEITAFKSIGAAIEDLAAAVAAWRAIEAG